MGTLSYVTIGIYMYPSWCQSMSYHRSIATSVFDQFIYFRDTQLIVAPELHLSCPKSHYPALPLIRLNLVLCIAYPGEVPSSLGGICGGRASAYLPHRKVSGTIARVPDSPLGGYQ